MEFFHQAHKTLLESTHPTFSRELLNTINWSDRLICIKGFRGVGKTTFLLDYLKQRFQDDNTVLYVNLNDFYFTRRTIISFADEFVKKGGKVLLLDQIQKYPHWAKEIRQCHDKLRGLKIIFTSSPVMRIVEEHPVLSGIIKIKLSLIHI